MLHKCILWDLDTINEGNPLTYPWKLLILQIMHGHSIEILMLMPTLPYRTWSPTAFDRMNSILRRRHLFDPSLSKVRIH